MCSENNGADQREADLRLCFRICKKTVFSQRGSYEPRQQFNETNASNMADSVAARELTKLQISKPCYNESKMYSYIIGKSVLNNHLGSSSDLCYILYCVIMNCVIKRLRCNNWKYQIKTYILI